MRSRIGCLASRHGVTLAVAALVAGSPRGALAVTSPTTPPATPQVTPQATPQVTPQVAPQATEAEHRAPGSMVVVEVDIDPGLADAEELGRWITEEVDGVLAALPVDSSYRGVVHINVGGSLYDFQIDLAALRDGEELVRLEPWSCECSYQELRAACREKLPLVVDALEVVDAQGSSAESDGSAESEYGPEPAAIAKAQKERRATQLGPAGIAAVTLLTTGVVGVATGVSFMAVGQTIESASGPLIRGRDFRSPGILLAGIGGSLALSGTIVLLTSDRINRRRTRSVGSVGLQVTPLGAGRRALLRVSGRF
ncbi:MAG: hypothetical protein AAGF11_27275 [Myxococcota bacterium]